MESQSLRGFDRERQILYDFAAVDLHGQAVEGGMIRELQTQIVDGIGVGEEGEGEADGNMDAPGLGDEIAPIFEDAADDEERQGAEMRIAPVGKKIGWRNDAP